MNHNIINKILNYYVTNSVDEEWSKYYLCECYDRYNVYTSTIIKGYNNDDIYQNLYDAISNTITITDDSKIYSKNVKELLINNAEITITKLKDIIIESQSRTKNLEIISPNQITDTHILKKVEEKIDRYNYYQLVLSYDEHRCRLIDVDIQNPCKRIFDDGLREYVCDYITILDEEKHYKNFLKKYAYLEIQPLRSLLNKSSFAYRFCHIS